MATEMTGRASRWRRRKELRPQEILAAALASFAERGFAAARLDDVARRAGVTKGTVYLYFPNKVELFKAVVAQALVPNLERGEALLDDGEAARAADLLAQLLRGWAELARSPAGAIPKIIVSEAGNFPDLARFYQATVVDRGMALMRRVVRLGIERGEFRGDIADDLDAIVRCLVAPLLVAMLWRHSFGRHDADGFDPDALCHIQLRLLLEGLVAQPPAPVDPTDPTAIDDAADRNREMLSL